MKIFIDQTGRQVELKGRPQRIVSLVPSQTELLHYLGLEEETVGITKFCVHPEQWFRNKKRVGGTKNVKLDRIEDLKPDLIIANKEENDKEQILALAEKYPLWLSDIVTLEDAYEMIETVGMMTGKEAKANELTTRLKTSFSKIKISKRKPKTAYLIWYNPLMAAANGTFIHSILNVAGLDNMFTEVQRYPLVNIDDLQKAKPDVILLSSEPFPFKQKHITEIQNACPAALIRLVDGELFSWYGSRLLHSAEYLQKLQEDILSVL